jgi:hypothetical protein
MSTDKSAARIMREANKKNARQHIELREKIYRKKRGLDSPDHDIEYAFFDCENEILRPLLKKYKNVEDHVKTL